jgi:hypothetical protein
MDHMEIWFGVWTTSHDDVNTVMKISGSIKYGEFLDQLSDYPFSGSKVFSFHLCDCFNLLVTYSFSGHNNPLGTLFPHALCLCSPSKTQSRVLQRFCECLVTFVPLCWQPVEPKFASTYCSLCAPFLFVYKLHIARFFVRNRVQHVGRISSA